MHKRKGRVLSMFQMHSHCQQKQRTRAGPRGKGKGGGGGRGGWRGQVGGSHWWGAGGLATGWSEKWA